MTTPRKSKHAKLLSFLKWMFWDFSAVRFAWEKIRPPDPISKKKPPATFCLWILGIYILFFAGASQRYQNRVDLIENRTNAILTLLVKDEVRKIAINRISSVQNMACPQKPNILNPMVTIKSLFGKPVHNDEAIDILKAAIVGFKKQLGEVNLKRGNLMRANLTAANLFGANLTGANLYGADLMVANLQKAKLQNAFLRDAFLQEVNLRRSNLQGANFQGANLRGADLREADLLGATGLTIEQLSQVKSLYQTTLEPDLMEQIKKKYPHLLEEPIDKKKAQDTEQ